MRLDVHCAANGHPWPPHVLEMHCMTIMHQCLPQVDANDVLVRPEMPVKPLCEDTDPEAPIVHLVNRQDCHWTLLIPHAEAALDESRLGEEPAQR